MLLIPEIMREHASQAAFQWAQRDSLANADLPDPEVIGSVDQRLEADLDALRIAGPAVGPYVIEQFEAYPERAIPFEPLWASELEVPFT